MRFQKGDHAKKMAQLSILSRAGLTNTRRPQSAAKEIQALGITLEKEEDEEVEKQRDLPPGISPLLQPLESDDSPPSSPQNTLIDQKPHKKIENPSFSPETKMSLPPGLPGYVLVSTKQLNNFFLRELKCKFCDTGFCSISDFKKVIVTYGFVVTCQVCFKSSFFQTSPHVPGEDYTEANLLLMGAARSEGLGREKVNSFLGAFAHPGITRNSWDWWSRKWENLVDEVWEEVEEENLVEEVQMMVQEVNDWRWDEEGRVKIEVTFDGTWSSRGYSSMLGFGTYFGVYSKKPLFTSYRCKICRVCQAAERKGVTPKEHSCIKNWAKSSGSMEADIAVEGALRLARKIVVWNWEVEVRIGYLVGDGDSKIDLHLSQSLPISLRDIIRFLDSNHFVKNFTKKLYDIKSLFPGGTLGPKPIEAFKRAFATELHREGTLEEKKERIENIPIHFFNLSHENCGDWCEGSEVGPSSLPYNEWMEDITYIKKESGEEISLLGEIKKAIQFYATESNLSKVDPKKSTNINEGYHGIFHRRYEIGGKNHLAPRADITQNLFASCAVSLGHSAALLAVFQQGGLPADSPIAEHLKWEAEEEEKEKKKRNERKKTPEAKKRKRVLRERRKVVKGSYKSGVELGGEKGAKKRKVGNGGNGGKGGNGGNGGNGGKEGGPKVYSCSNCHQPGHNKRKCPLLQKK